MIDNYRHKGLRKQLVQEIEAKGIRNEDVLAAIGKIPRHFFLDNAFVEFAYSNKAFPIGAGQTISHPYTVAFQSELLQIKKGDKVLEIGTGSGYQTTVLCELGAKVFSIERQKELYDKTKIILRKMKYSAKLFYGDGYKGNIIYQPFDSIIVTCGAPFVPEDLLKQLKIGGRLVIPVGDLDNQVMTLIIRKSETDFSKKEYGDFKFVPMLENKNR
jgi:protein-L-isoaspartate(D-aspartate) O-methyltransferase